MSQEAFHNKWSEISEEKNVEADEKSLFVEQGNEPITQRQLNLYYYFLFIQKHLEKIEAKDVIEVGCGRGTIALYLAQYLGMNMTLLDNEKDAIGIARDAFAAHRKNAVFHVGDALNTQLRDASFDATVSIGLAEHLESVDELFKEQYRILRPGGVMVSLNIPKKFSIQSLNNINRCMKKLTGSYKAKIGKDYYRNTLNPHDYAQAAKRVGFTATEITRVCPFPIYVPLSMKNDKRVTIMRKMILALRSVFQKYPYKTNAIAAQAHFLVAHKPA